ncbi:methionyl-tRNA formyltransferase-like [Eucalyptus grandis]|uniref:methionyl-tRNA formyltransferase-like n=1 Tax=Eucalyptus grandis TaxID=71139 RepID=UPI00192F1166|nr:methionyl-tRNA formyltransferase-like [Eucalyptus grandis]
MLWILKMALQPQPVCNQLRLLISIWNKWRPGSKLLIRELPSLLDGSAQAEAKPQDETKVTLAPKITPEESWLCFNEEAVALHNKVGGPFFHVLDRVE